MLFRSESKIFLSEGSITIRINADETATEE
jgi:hypothetical protein